MACFIVPALEAVVTTIATKLIEKRELKLEKGSFSVKLKRLNGLLWGGSALLAFEHLWHGEIQPFFPFLTAVGNPADTEEMLHEMRTVGVSMAVLVTAVWGIMTLVLGKIEKNNSQDTKALKGETA